MEARGDAPFERLGDLERVSGIGPKTVESVSDWLVVDRPDAAALRSSTIPGDDEALRAREPDHG